MGCDILMHVQVKGVDGWEWSAQDIFTHRDYTLFGILSGMRSSEFEPISEMKGFPKDSLDQLKLIDDKWGELSYETESGVYLGYCGVSYLTLEELLAFDWRKHDTAFFNETMPFLYTLAKMFGGLDKVRIVFGYTV